MRDKREETYQVLVRQVQRPRSILLNAEMQRLNPLLPLPIRSVLQELQPRPPEALLLLEDALIVDRDLDGDVVGAVEPRGRAAGELEDGRPLEVVALDVVRVVEGPTTACV